ncbi:MAG: hypothetical protein ACI4QT_07365, partial [Kiritimatiellia bacterium]
SSAIVFTWNDASGDHAWDNPENWTKSTTSATNDVPCLVDAVSFPASVNGVADYPVYLNGHRYAQKISFAKGAKAMIGTEGDELSVDGSISGSSASICARVHFLQDASSGGGDAGSIFFLGGADGDVVLTNSGNLNSKVAISNTAFSVKQIIASAGGVYYYTSPDPATELTLASLTSNSNGNRTGLNIFDRILPGTVISTSGSAGGLTLFNTIGDTAQLIHSFSLRHTSGNLGLRSTASSGKSIVANLESLSVASDAILDINVGSTFSASFPEGPDATTGFYPHNYHSSFYFLTTNANGFVTSATTYPLLEADGSMEPTKAYRTTMTEDWTLQEDREALALLRYSTTGELNVNLNGHKLSLGSLRLNTAQSLTIQGDGEMEWTGEHIYIAAYGAGDLRFSSPCSWRKPASVPDGQYPSLVIMGASKPNIIFDGGDKIRDYGKFVLDCQHATLAKVTFADNATRTFHGDLVGRFEICNEGPGTLRFNGQRMVRGWKISLNGGTTIVGHGNGIAPSVVTNGAVFAIADGVSYQNNIYAALFSGSVYCMEGNDASTKDLQISNDGVTIAGGLPGETGTFRVTGTFRPIVDYSIGFKIGADDASKVIVQKYGNSSASNANTITIQVQDVSNGERSVRAVDSFPVVQWSATDKFTPENMAFEIENLSPGTIDTSCAAVFYNAETKSFDVSGIRSRLHTLITLQ